MSLVRRSIYLERKLNVGYKDAKGMSSERVIWPFLLIYFDGGLLIAAWCEMRGGIRHFRTDRIDSLSEISARYPQRRHSLIKLWRASDTSSHLN